MNNTNVYWVNYKETRTHKFKDGSTMTTENANGRVLVISPSLEAIDYSRLSWKEGETHVINDVELVGPIDDYWLSKS